MLQHHSSLLHEANHSFLAKQNSIDHDLIFFLHNNSNFYTNTTLTSLRSRFLGNNTTSSPIRPSNHHLPKHIFTFFQFCDSTLQSNQLVILKKLLKITSFEGASPVMHWKNNVDFVYVDEDRSGLVCELMWRHYPVILQTVNWLTTNQEKSNLYMF